jgi:hypothetical protein
LDGAQVGPERSTDRITLTASPDLPNLGHALGPPADATGDGQPDLLLYTEEDNGGVWIVPGEVTGQVVLQDAAIARLRGVSPDDDAGDGGTRGADVNGDGYGDLLVGAPLSAGRRGTVYLVHGPVTEDVALADADARLVGDWDGDDCGAKLSVLPDVDDDGTEDPVLSCPRDAFFGSPAPGRIQAYRGSDLSGVLGVADAAAVWVSDSAYDFAGEGLDGRYDVDGSGRPDLVVTVPYDETGQGVVFLLHDPTPR